MVIVAKLDMRMDSATKQNPTNHKKFAHFQIGLIYFTIVKRGIYFTNG
jgi:hypothetical protein